MAPPRAGRIGTTPAAVGEIAPGLVIWLAESGFALTKSVISDQTKRYKDQIKPVDKASEAILSTSAGHFSSQEGT
jgi:hypothetical protein